MQTRRVGRLQLSVLDDGTLRFPARFFFRDVPEEVWRKELDVDADGKILVGHNCGLVKAEHELIVIDTGYGDDTHGGRTGHLLEELARTGHQREQVTRVINTHAHGDHIKRNTMVQGGQRAPTFPHARYHLGRADWEWFNGPAGRVHEFKEHVVTLQQLGVLALVDGEQRIAPDVSLRPTPGHTPGHTSVLIASRGQTAIFLGDVCHLPVHFEHPDWVSTFDTHPDETPRTRAQIFQLAIERDALLVCPHALPPGLGRLQQTSSGGFQWQRVT